MNTLGYKQYHHRHLPHIHTPGHTFLVTYRLADSIPVSVFRQYEAEKKWLEQKLQQVTKLTDSSKDEEPQAVREKWEESQRQWFFKLEEILDRAGTGPMWLQEKRLAKIVADNLHYHDQTAYHLHAYCIMSNHVHLVLTPFLNEAELQEGHNETGHLTFSSKYPSLSRIMHSLKSYTAKQCNKVLGRQGRFWSEESFDHTIRAGRFEKTINYVLQNPVKAGLVNDWQDWEWSYKQECTTGGPPV
ncbi:MAG: hypothetical protein JST84_18440 [Acidobacteria bacterium]|nr:hypothetical protein [Acidobacteriota bacterium]